MNCTECQDLIFEYTDNTLPEQTRLDIDSHLASCLPCRSLVSQEQALCRNIPAALEASLTRAKIDPAMRRNILLNTASPSPEETPFRYIPLWLAAAALLVTSLATMTRYAPTPAAHPASSIQTMATVYSDSSQTYWTKRTFILKKSNGTESYLTIVATRPQRFQITTRKQGGNT